MKAPMLKISITDNVDTFIMEGKAVSHQLSGDVQPTTVLVANNSLHALLNICEQMVIDHFDSWSADDLSEQYGESYTDAQVNQVLNLLAEAVKVASRS